MRGSLLSLALLALIGLLAASACHDPAIPFLQGAAGRTWWVDPEPLSGHRAFAASERTYRFTPARAGRLEIAAMSQFELRCAGRILATGPLPGQSWKQPQRLTVPAAAMEVWTRDARLLPALALGGEAAPEQVTIDRPSGEVTALEASLLHRFRPLRGSGRATLALALLAALAMVAAFALLLARPPADPLPPDPPRRSRVWLAFTMFAMLVAWNVARFPALRGLDAGGHLEYIRLIQETQRLPAPTAGWQTYHPPLYHALAASAARRAGVRGAQVLSGLLALALVALVVVGCGRGRWRGPLLILSLPVLLVSAPQVSNEVGFAALITASLLLAGRGSPTSASAAGAGLLAGLALLTRYTAVPFLLAIVLAPLLARARSRRTAVGLSLMTLGSALLIGVWPYLERMRVFGDPFIGNWDDELGHPYRQPPGVRTAAWFLRFGASLIAHPFEARNASLWDSLYVSTFGDGFGRFISTPGQHAALLALAWLALPLTLAILAGAPALLGDPAERDSIRLERTCGVAAVCALAALVRFNLELPYWSAGKGVFLLGLALPVALAFERGSRRLREHGGRVPGMALDLILAAFAVTSGLTFLYRS